MVALTVSSRRATCGSSRSTSMPTRCGQIDEDKINALVTARAAARKAKNFGESDRIRDELAAMGVVLKDTNDGTTWEVER